MISNRSKSHGPPAWLAGGPATVTCLSLLCLVGPSTLHAQVAIGELVSKTELVATLPADSVYEAARELVRAHPGRLTTMKARFVSGERRGGILEHRDVFIALHAPPREGVELARRGVVALREDSLYRVLYIAELDVGIGFVARLETLKLSSRRFDVNLLHVRYAQTGSGGVTEDLLFALGADGRLVDVPIVYADIDHLLEEGEYFCCARFTSFDEEAVEFTVFVTRSGRAGVTHKVRSRFELEGDFEYDAEVKQYRPGFRLVPAELTGREVN